MNRAERRRLVARRVNGYMQQHNVGDPNTTRRERRSMARVLRKRVMKEAPPTALETAARTDQRIMEGGVIVAPRVIIPELEVQAQGVETGKQERRSPGGRIILP
jgi:hypothetical protein